jgi:hypothetical protein
MAMMYKDNGYCLKRTIFATTETELDEKKKELLNEAGLQVVDYGSTMLVEATSIDDGELKFLVPREEVVHPHAKKLGE